MLESIPAKDVDESIGQVTGGEYADEIEDRNSKFDIYSRIEVSRKHVLPSACASSQETKVASVVIDPHYQLGIVSFEGVG